MAMGDLEVEDIGNCAIEANDDIGNFYYIVIETNFTCVFNGYKFGTSGFTTAIVTLYPIAANPLATSPQNTLVPAAFCKPVITCKIFIRLPIF